MSINHLTDIIEKKWLLIGAKDINVYDTLNVNGNINFLGSNSDAAVYLDNDKKLASVQLTDGQILIGETGHVPIAANIIGTPGQVSVINGPGSIQIGLSSTGSLLNTSLSLTNTSNQIFLGTGKIVTLNAPTPSNNRTYRIPDVGINSDFILSNGTQSINGDLKINNLTCNTINAASNFTNTGTLTTQDITCNSINNSGTLACTGVTCSGITSSGDFNNGTNSMTSGNISCSNLTASNLVQSNTLLTTNGGYSNVALGMGSNTRGFFTDGTDVILNINGVLAAIFTQGQGLFPGNSGYLLGSSVNPWGTLNANNVNSLNSSLGGSTCSNLSVTGTTSLTGALSCGAITSSNLSTGLVTSGAISNSGTMSTGTITCSGNINNPSNTINTHILNCDVLNLTGTSSMGGITCTSLSNSGTTSLTGALTCSSINAGTNPETVGALSTTSLSNSGTTSLTGTLTCGAINAGTNAETVGALTTTSISNSGTINSTGNISCTSATLSAGTVSCGSTSTINGLTVSGAGSATDAGSIAVFSGNLTANLLGISIKSNGYDTMRLGINGTGSTGQIPAGSLFITSNLTSENICIGRGNSTGLPNFADIKIDSGGNVYCTNGSLSTTALSASSQSWVSFIPSATMSLTSSTTVTSITTWNTTATRTQGSAYITNNGTTFTVGTGGSGVYQVTYSVTLPASTTGYAKAYIARGGDTMQYGNSQEPFPNGTLPTAQPITLTGSASILLAATNTITIQIAQNTGGTINILSTDGSSNIIFSKTS